MHNTLLSRRRPLESFLHVWNRRPRAWMVQCGVKGGNTSFSPYTCAIHTIYFHNNINTENERRLKLSLDDPGNKFPVSHWWCANLHSKKKCVFASILILYHPLHTATHTETNTTHTGGGCSRFLVLFKKKSKEKKLSFFQIVLGFVRAFLFIYAPVSLAVSLCLPFTALSPVGWLLKSFKIMFWDTLFIRPPQNFCQVSFIKGSIVTIKAQPFFFLLVKQIRIK